MLDFPKLPMMATLIVGLSSVMNEESKVIARFLKGAMLRFVKSESNPTPGSGGLSGFASLLLLQQLGNST